MQPVVRIALLLLVVVALPFLPQWALIGLPLVFLVPLLRVRVFPGLHRVRWLLFAVLVLYLVIDMQVVEALSRAALLVCAVGAVQIALHGLSPAQLTEGLAHFLPARFAQRLSMTLEAVPEVQGIIADTPAPQEGSPIARLAGRAAAVIQRIESS